jgi:hypothetical protein
MVVPREDGTAYGSPLSREDDGVKFDAASAK